MPEAVVAKKSQKYEHAVNLFRKGDYEQAAFCLSESLLEESSSEKWNDWATAKFLGGHAAEAEGGYRRALELDPDNVQAIANLGAVLAGQQRFSEAIPLLEFSLTRGKNQEAAKTIELLNACKAGLARGVTPESGEMRRFCESFTRGLSLQTVSLDRVLFRVMSMENEMRLFTKRCEGMVEEVRGKVSTPPPTRKIIPTISISEICPELPAVELHAPIGVDGNVSLYELVVISALAKRRAPRGVFEIGTFDGRTALNLAANLPANGKVFTLDLPRAAMKNTALPLGHDDVHYVDKDTSGGRFADNACRGKIVQLYGDSATFDFTPYQGQIDFVFVDGSHAYKYVMNDSRKALSLLRNGKGIILWHDYPSWQGVAEALNELFVKDPVFGKLRNIEGTQFAYLEI